MDMTRNIITMGLTLQPNTVYRTIWYVDGKEVYNSLATTPGHEDPDDFLQKWADTVQHLFDIQHVDIQVFEVVNDTRD